MTTAAQPRVALFVTCLVNLFRPSVGFASIKLLEDAGCIVDVPEHQSCCGQPGYNPGDFASARKIAKQVIKHFNDYDYVVVPSGSCAGMLRVHYPTLLKDSDTWRQKAEALSKKTYELTSFLVDILHYQPSETKTFTSDKVCYHDACAGLRELGIKQQPRQLLSRCNDLTVTELEKTEECCGFGGTFCAKMPEISAKMASNKLEDIQNSGADTLLAGDLGCLLNIAGLASRQNRPITVRHVAEVLAGDCEGPGIAAPDNETTTN